MPTKSQSIQVGNKGLGAEVMSSVLVQQALILLLAECSVHICSLEQCPPLHLNTAGHHIIYPWSLMPVNSDVRVTMETIILPAPPLKKNIYSNLFWCSINHIFTVILNIFCSKMPEDAPFQV